MKKMSQENSESSNKTLEVLEQLFFVEHDEIVKCRRFDAQGSGKLEV